MTTIMFRRVATFLSLLTLSLCATAFASPGQSASNNALLYVKLGPVHVKVVSIADALREIRSAAPSRSVFFTLEVAAFEKGPEKNLTLELRQSTLGQALNAIETQDHRYTHELIDSHLVHVFPREAKHDPQDLLNIAVNNLTIPETQYDALLQYPRYFIPELEAEIERRSGANGYAASILGGVNLPKISLSLQKGTVRDVLNAVAQKTETFSKIRPTGWIYTFRIDKSNRLGGEPTWRLF